MSLQRKFERSRREAIAATVLAVSQWLDEQAKGKVPVAAQALRDAAGELRKHVFQKGQSSVDFYDGPEAA